MQKLVLVLGLIVLSVVGFSQGKTHPNSFKIEKMNSSKKVQKYTSALLKANMESFRLRDEDVILEFEEGFTCLLYSASSLSRNQIQADVNSYKVNFTKEYELPIFSISEEGIIVATYQKAYK